MTGRLRSLTSNHLPLTSVIQAALVSPDSTNEKGVQLGYGTSVVLLMCPFMPEIMSEGFLGTSGVFQL
jgi:hypothetical protein